MNRSLLLLSLIIATIAVSWAAIFIRLAEANPIAIAFYRMGLAAVILFPFGIRGLWPSLGKLSVPERMSLLASGLFLGFHFAAWISSLSYTSISNSVILVSTQPFFVAAAEAIIWKAKIERRTVWGMVMAFAGMTIISSSGFSLGSERILGDFLALIGAVCAGGYLLLGRRIRQSLDNRHYILSVYSLAAMTLFVIALVTRSPLTGFTWPTWGYFLLLALIPTIVGHSLYNYLLRYIRAHLVGITILGEPIGASVFAVLIFAEYPSPATYAGGIMILSGIALALLRLKSDEGESKSA